jgi:hypothetical protein
MNKQSKKITSEKEIENFLQVPNVNQHPQRETQVESVQEHIAKEEQKEEET